MFSALTEDDLAQIVELSVDRAAAAPQRPPPRRSRSRPTPAPGSPSAATTRCSARGRCAGSSSPRSRTASRWRSSSGGVRDGDVVRVDVAADGSSLVLTSDGPRRGRADADGRRGRDRGRAARRLSVGDRGTRDPARESIERAHRPGPVGLVASRTDARRDRARARAGHRDRARGVAHRAADGGGVRRAAVGRASRTTRSTRRATARSAAPTSPSRAATSALGVAWVAAWASARSRADPVGAARDGGCWRPMPCRSDRRGRTTRG